mgnify:CR=1 FL=1
MCSDSEKWRRRQRESGGAWDCGCQGAQRWAPHFSCKSTWALTRHIKSSINTCTVIYVKKPAGPRSESNLVKLGEHSHKSREL